MVNKGSYIVSGQIYNFKQNFAGFSLSFYTALLLHYTIPCVPETEAYEYIFL